MDHYKQWDSYVKCPLKNELIKFWLFSEFVFTEKDFYCKQLDLLHLIPSQNVTNYLLVALVLRPVCCNCIVIYWLPKYAICKAYSCLPCSCSCGSFSYTWHWCSLVCCCWATFCVSYLNTDHWMISSTINFEMRCIPKHNFSISVPLCFNTGSFDIGLYGKYPACIDCLVCLWQQLLPLNRNHALNGPLKLTATFWTGPSCNISGFIGSILCCFCTIWHSWHFLTASFIAEEHPGHQTFCCKRFSPFVSPNWPISWTVFTTSSLNAYDRTNKSFM